MARRLPIFLRPAEQKALLLAAHSPRDRVIFLLGVNTGLRVSELVRLTVEDVDLDGAALMVRGGKGDKDRMVPIPHHALEELERWIGFRVNGYVFEREGKRGRPSKTDHLSTRWIEVRIAEAAARAGIQKRITPHKLRHTYATNLLKTGSDIRIIQGLLGHSRLATTEIYTHVNPDQYRGAVERLSEVA